MSVVFKLQCAKNHLRYVRNTDSHAIPKFGISRSGVGPQVFNLLPSILLNCWEKNDRLLGEAQRFGRQQRTEAGLNNGVHLLHEAPLRLEDVVLSCNV